MRVAIIGAGYVGLVSGVSLARSGHQITLVEHDPDRLRQLAEGRMPIEEPGLADAFSADRSRLDVVASFSQVETPDLAMIAVGTPVGDDGDSDLSQLTGAMRQLSQWSDTDITVRSTLPPGTSERLPSLLGRSDGAHLSTNPEFLRQGSALSDFEHPTRIIVGRYAETGAAHLAKLRQLYAPISAPWLEVDVAAAELIKNVANGFLALKLSFVNEVAALSEEYGVDVDQVLGGIALDPRIGSSFMRPGLGFGGSCLPKELQVLANAGRRQGLAMHVARAASLVNAEQQDRFVRRLLRELDTDEARVGVLGLSFKSGTDDLRGSPALTIVRRLLHEGHRVVAFDPAVRGEQAAAAAPGLEVATSAADVFDDADAVVIGTEWPEFGTLDLPGMRARTRGALLYDGRNLLDPADAARAGFAYRGVGRRPLDPAVAVTRS